MGVQPMRATHLIDCTMIIARLTVGSLFVACCAAAQPAPELAPTPAIAVKSGQAIEVTFSGQHLGKLKSANLVDPRGLTASLAGEPKDDQIRINLAAGPDAPPGERQL